MNISEILGTKYANLETAKVFVKPGQVVVKDHKENYFIVKKDAFIKFLFPLNYNTALNS